MYLQFYALFFINYNIVVRIRTEPCKQRLKRRLYGHFAIMNIQYANTWNIYYLIAKCDKIQTH